MAKRVKRQTKSQLIIQLNGFICTLIALYINKGDFIDFTKYQKLYIGLFIYWCLSGIIYKVYLQMKVKKRYLKSGIQDVDQMGGVEFENFLKYHFRTLGYAADTTAATGDYGADLILRKDHERIIVQAKRWKEKVGIKAIQEVIGAVGFYKADKGYVITNNFFTKPAVNLAKANNIELWDREKLITVMTKENLQENIQMIKQEANQKVAGNVCPWCGKDLVKRNGRNGAFLGCSCYPKCKFTKSV